MYVCVYVCVCVCICVCVCVCVCVLTILKVINGIYDIIDVTLKGTSIWYEYLCYWL